MKMQRTFSRVNTARFVPVEPPWILVLLHQKHGAILTIKTAIIDKLGGFLISLDSHIGRVMFQITIGSTALL
jgi:hypothetical protein